MILCDTNILIEFYKNNARIVEALRQVGVGEIAISVITQAELYFGALNGAELRQIKNHLSLLHIYPLDIPISQRFLVLMESYSLSHKMNIPDALIAAIALVHNIELYTLNTRDFHYIPDLKLYQPSTS